MSCRKAADICRLTYSAAVKQVERFGPDQAATYSRTAKKDVKETSTFLRSIKKDPCKSASNYCKAVASYYELAIPQNTTSGLDWTRTSGLFDG
ncbi:unnamed protein product, partial [Mesorhabditis belari]|uniref:Uncharacterized protein n=1 Tax=Mesorhabditis belari TaxID=2138241 RepID=A0AAF3J6U2_9BILA